MDVEAAAALHRAGALDQAEAAYLQLIAAGSGDRAILLQLLALARVQAGRLEAALDAYDAAAAGGGADAGVHQARGDCLHALGRAAEALDAYAAALALEPRRAAAHANRALALLDLGRAEAAVAACDAALALEPDDVGVWVNHSAALRAADRLPEAEASAGRALALRPGFADALNALGLARAARNDFAGALNCYDSALKAAPNHRDALNNAGVALTALGRFDEARARHAAALARDPGFAEAEYNLGLLALRGGDDAGWRGYEARWRRRGQPGPSFPDAALWRGDADVSGLTVLLHAEQGLGDTLQFARYAPRVKARGARVALRVQPALLRLMRSLDGVDDLTAEDAPPGPFDRHVPLMSLGGVFGVEGGGAYLRADPAEAMAWRERWPTAAGRLRIGLAWSGNPAHGDDRNRSLPFARLAPLLARDAAFVSLQPETRRADAAALAASGVATPPLGDFAGTAALLQTLDLAISVDTAVAHLAGALGRPTWLLLPRFPDWRWGANGDATPWYATLRLFRQAEFDRWEPVIEAVGAALDAVLAARDLSEMR